MSTSSTRSQQFTVWICTSVECLSSRWSQSTTQFLPNPFDSRPSVGIASLCLVWVDEGIFDVDLFIWSFTLFNYEWISSIVHRRRSNKTCIRCECDEKILSNEWSLFSNWFSQSRAFDCVTSLTPWFSQTFTLHQTNADFRRMIQESVINIIDTCVPLIDVNVRWTELLNCVSWSSHSRHVINPSLYRLRNFSLWWFLKHGNTLPWIKSIRSNI